MLGRAMMSFSLLNTTLVQRSIFTVWQSTSLPSKQQLCVHVVVISEAPNTRANCSCVHENPAHHASGHAQHQLMHMGALSCFKLCNGSTVLAATCIAPHEQPLQHNAFAHSQNRCNPTSRHAATVPCCNATLSSKHGNKSLTRHHARAEPLQPMSDC